MSFKPIHDPTHLYFITASIVEWLPLFADNEYASIVLHSLDWHRKQKQNFLYAFVIMPTHVHWISKPCEPYNISEVLQSFSSYTAHEILKTLRLEGRDEWLAVFAEHAKPGKKHRIWQKPLAKNVYSKKFLDEKLEYIHSNPVNKKWQLVPVRADYGFSSARFYDRGEGPIISVDDIRQMFVDNG